MLCRDEETGASIALINHQTQHVRRLILESTFEEPIAPSSMKLFRDMPLGRNRNSAALYSNSTVAVLEGHDSADRPKPKCREVLHLVAIGGKRT